MRQEGCRYELPDVKIAAAPIGWRWRRPFSKWHASAIWKSFPRQPRTGAMASLACSAHPLLPMLHHASVAWQLHAVYWCGSSCSGVHRLEYHRREHNHKNSGWTAASTLDTTPYSMHKGPSFSSVDETLHVGDDVGKKDFAFVDLGLRPLHVSYSTRQIRQPNSYWATPL